MFSPPIDPPKVPIVPTVQPRHTEASDAKMAIRQHEEQARKKKDQDDGQKDSPFGAIDDDMVLSVQALIDFLENFIRTQRDQAGHTARTESTANGVNGDAQPAPYVTPQAAHAANAYAHAASVRTPHPASTMTSTAEPTADEATGPELRRAMALVAKLRALDARGVPGVHLAPGPDFLGSLEAAINAA